MTSLYLFVKIQVMDFIKILKLISLGLKGSVLGISMVLPGISGGTMAFVMGIYDKLIGEIAKFKIRGLKNVFLFFSFRKSQRKEILSLFLKTWDWNFLIPLFLGILLSVVVFANWATPLIEEYHLEFYSLIFGLILASLFPPLKDMKKNVRTFSLFFISLISNSLLFTLGKNLVLFSGDVPVLAFLPAGFLISAALIVPGLSGSYLLLILGLYEKTLSALKDWDFSIILVFILGMFLGLLSTARLIRYWLKKHFHETLAVILGLIAGGLYAIYPLPKESWGDLISFTSQNQIFWTYSLISFLLFMAFPLFYRLKSQKELGL